MLDSGTDDQRLSRLIDVGRSLLSELDPDVLLDRLLETARELTSARYAAVGILDEQRTGLARFLTRGVDEATHRAIGDLPRGNGILGVLIEDARPLRLHDVGEHPQSYGFPSGHPPMHAFLGVPVVIRGEAWGNLYLTEKEGGGDFTAEDEEAVVVLADWAAIAIENARLYGDAARRGDELERAARALEATSAIARAVGGETSLERVLELVVKRGRALVEARVVLILLREGDELVVSAVAGMSAPRERVRFPLAEATAGDVLTEGRARRVADVGRQLRWPAARLGVPDAESALLVPLVFRGSALGVLVAFDHLHGEPRFSRDDEELLEAFAAQAATAVATARTVEAERLRRSIESAESERRRWARELHDETLQALGGLKLLLGAASRLDDPQAMREALGQASEHVGREIEGLRALIAELRPAALDDLGLGPALRSLLQRTAGAQGLEIDQVIELGDAERRFAPEMETAVYRLVQESLTNVVKHAGARRVRVVVREEGGALELEVADDGVGLDAETSAGAGGFGLVGMRERVELAGGELDVAARPHGGTVVRARLPL
jgi:signal transduction histidine kinase